MEDQENCQRQHTTIVHSDRPAKVSVNVPAAPLTLSAAVLAWKRAALKKRLLLGLGESALLALDLILARASSRDFAARGEIEAAIAVGDVMNVAQIGRSAAGAAIAKLVERGLIHRVKSPKRLRVARVSDDMLPFAAAADQPRGSDDRLSGPEMSGCAGQTSPAEPDGFGQQSPAEPDGSPGMDPEIAGPAGHLRPAGPDFSPTVVTSSSFKNNDGKDTASPPSSRLDRFADPVAIPTALEIHASLEREMLDAGIRRSAIAEIFREGYPPQLVLSWLSSIRSMRKRPENPTGFLLAALRRGFTLPASGGSRPKHDARFAADPMADFHREVDQAIQELRQSGQYAAARQRVLDAANPRERALLENNEKEIRLRVYRQACIERIKQFNAAQASAAQPSNPSEGA